MNNPWEKFYLKYKKTLWVFQWSRILKLLNYKIVIIFLFLIVIMLLSFFTTVNKKEKLHLFYNLMEDSPLFYSPYMDTNNFKTIIEELDKEQKEIMTDINLDRQFIPIDFLKNFVETSGQYKNFIQNPSHYNSYQLLNNIEKTINSYKENAINLKKSLEFYDDNKSYIFIGEKVFTNAKTAIDDIEKIIKNAENAKIELQKRKKCLNCLFNCKEICSSNFKDFNYPKLIEEKEYNFNVFSKEKSTIGYMEPDKEIGPFVVKSPCWSGEMKDNLLYSGIKCSEIFSNHCAEFFKLATNNYYLKNNRKSLAEKNHPFDWLLQRETQTYSCSNNEYKPKLATINFFYTEYRNNKIFKKLKKSEIEFPEHIKRIIDKGLIAENRFFEKKYPDEDYLNNLAHFYGYLYKYLKYDTNIKEIEKDDLLKRYLIINGKMADLDLIFNHYAGYTKYKRKSITLDEKSKLRTLSSKAYFYIIWSNYSLTYLNFSPFVWKSNDKMEFLKTSNFLSSKKNSEKRNPPYFDYQSLSELIGEEKIAEIQKESKIFYKVQFFHDLMKKK